MKIFDLLGTILIMLGSVAAAVGLALISIPAMLIYTGVVMIIFGALFCRRALSLGGE